MTRMKLSEYVLAQADREDAVGDLARDAAADPRWPKGDYGTLAGYLYGKAAPDLLEALRAAEHERARDEA